MRDGAARRRSDSPFALAIAPEHSARPAPHASSGTGQQTRAGPGTATAPLRARHSPSCYLPEGVSPQALSTRLSALLHHSTRLRAAAGGGCCRCLCSGGDGEAEAINGSLAAPAPASLLLWGRAAMAKYSHGGCLQTASKGPVL